MALLLEVVDAALMDASRVPAQPPCSDLVPADVERALLVTGTTTPGWEDPARSGFPTDSGSADLLLAVGGCLLAAARNSVLHARSAITRTVDGWQGSGDGQERWRDESARTPARVERWIGTPWW